MIRKGARVDVMEITHFESLHRIPVFTMLQFIPIILLIC